jgi:hypothetical protein
MTKKYTREDRYKAAALFIGTGNSMAVSRETGIPASTIRHWLQHDGDFQMICQEYQAECGEKWRYKYAQIIDEATDQVLDRIRNGDFVRDTKTGELNRVPVKAKELTIIEAIHFDKLRLLESQPTKITRHESDANLERLVAQFSAIGEADGDEAARLIEKMGGTPPPGLKKDKDA